MKITRRQLRRIIQEELRRAALSEDTRQEDSEDCRAHAQEHLDDVDAELKKSRINWDNVNTAWKGASELIVGHDTLPWDNVAQSEDEKLTMAKNELSYWQADLQNKKRAINCEQG